MSHNPYAPPTSTTETPPSPALQPGDGPSGLSGWLVVVALGLIASPIRLSIFLWQTFPPIFRDGTWETLTTPGPAPYHPFWGPLLLGEIIINSLFVAVSVYLIVLFFRKSSRFPKYYIAFLIANLVFILVDALAAKIVLPDQPVLDPDTARELTRAVIGVAIWVPYLLVSKRVKNTFLRTDA